MGTGAMTMSVANNTQVDEYWNINVLTRRQMTGFFALETAFTALLRQYVIDTCEIKTPSLDRKRNRFFQGGLRVKAVKLPHTVFVADCNSWVKTVQMTPQLQIIQMSQLQVVHQS